MGAINFLTFETEKEFMTINQAELEILLLKHIHRENYQPVKPKVIIKQLKLPDEMRSMVRRTIKRLAKRGKIKYGPRHVVFPIKPEKQKEIVQQQQQKETPPARKVAASTAEPKKPLVGIVGIFRTKSKGFGFVRPQGTPAERGRADDIFIPRKKTFDAVDGDEVLVKLDTRKRGDKGPSGRIIEVLDRRTHRFVGTYYEQFEAGFVTVDNEVFEAPIYVGDAGAKNARSEDKVVIEIVRFPTHKRDGEGVLVDVLGPRGEPGVDTLSVIHSYNLRDEFPQEVLDNAHEQAEKFDESIGDDREDFTDVTVLTIDPFDARDFDDAISLEQTENGHWKLGVHIADVSYFVPAGSKLDQEAQLRATSVYLPDRVLPMLPEVISNNLASLQPDKIRYTKSAFLEFTADGIFVDATIHRGAIKSNHRFNYEEVDEYLADSEPWREKLEPEVFDLLGRMHTLAMILRGRRKERGALELSLPELKLDLDSDGKVCGAHLVENTESHQIIEEFMLAANEAVAETFARREISFLRRIHGLPNHVKLRQLTNFIRHLGVDCHSLEDRFEIQRILNEFRDKPEEYAVNFAILKAMQKAVYSPAEEGHYALASKAYCHFTSPIRRYPDLHIHRICDAIIDGQTPPNEPNRLVKLGDHCSDCEQRAEAAERELKKLKLVTFIAGKIGEEMEGVITGVEDYGLFVQGTGMPAEGLVSVRNMPRDFYDYDINTMSLMGRKTGKEFRLGDKVIVSILKADVESREIDFELIRHAENEKAT